MLVFVDESGDTGFKIGHGSSEVMTVTLILFNSESTAQDVDNRITALRTELHKPLSFEFHFKNNSDSVREAFFRAIAPFDFQFAALVINKALLVSAGYTGHDEFYRDACAQVFDTCKSSLMEANVKIDKSGSHKFRLELAAYLKRTINLSGAEERAIKEVKMQESKGNNLLQMADMVCGAVSRHYRADREGSTQFHKIIAHRELAVRVWPESLPHSLSENAERTHP